MKKFYSFLFAVLAFLAVSAQNPTLYLRGDVGGNTWPATDEFKFAESDGIYTLHVKSLSGSFKIADKDWNPYNLGSGDVVTIGGTYTLTAGGSALSVSGTLTDVDLTFTLSNYQLKVEQGESTETGGSTGDTEDPVDAVQSAYVDAIVGTYEGNAFITDFVATNWSCNVYRTETYNSGDIPAVTITKGEGVNELIIDGLVVPVSELPVSSIKARFVEDTSYDGYVGVIYIDPQVIGSCTDASYPADEVTIAASWSDNAWYKSPENAVEIWVTSDYQLSPGNWCLWGNYWGTWYMLEIGYYDDALTKVQSSVIDNIVGAYEGNAFITDFVATNWTCNVYRTETYNSGDVPAVTITKGEGANELIIDGLVVPVSVLPVSSIKATFTEDSSYDGYVGVITIEPQVIGSCTDASYPADEVTIAASWSDNAWYKSPENAVEIWVTSDYQLYPYNWCLWGNYWDYWYMLEIGYYDGVLTKVANSVSSITVDENAPVEYFNLQGVRVANPENGIFIRRQGNKATKVLVK